MVNALIMPVLRPLKSLKTSSTVLGLYCPPSISKPQNPNRNFQLPPEKKTKKFPVKIEVAGATENGERGGDGGGRTDSGVRRRGWRIREAEEEQERTFQCSGERDWDVFKEMMRWKLGAINKEFHFV